MEYVKYARLFLLCHMGSTNCRNHRAHVFSSSGCQKSIYATIRRFNTYIRAFGGV